ncbi:MAG: diaminopimelate decarboxylase [Ferruginibacter sp.]|nr:diaminopimelate decarboxylase [Cytophagales bacterium]
MQLTNQHHQVQGLRILDLCAEFGTPLYLYDTAVIAEKIRAFQSAFHGLDLRIKYAAKSLTNLSILKFMRSQGIGLDVVSIQELELGLLAGFEPGDIVFTPNCVSFEEIQRGVERGVMVNLDNLPMLERFGQEYNDRVPCCVRINPHIAAGGNYKIQTGHADSKFGISVLQLARVKQIVDAYHLDVAGLHVHTGSDFQSAEAFVQAAQILFKAAHDYPNLRFIDFGSGFKVAYREGDAVTDVADLGIQLGEAFAQFCESYGRSLQICFEPGKFLVSECGLLLVKTNVVKTTPTRTFVGVDSGLNHLLRPMLYDAFHDIVNVSNVDATNQRVYTVVGYICETDTLGWDRTLNEVRPGDILALKNAGAYGFSMSSNYNSRFRPAEVLVHHGQAHLIRRRETMEDLLRNQVVVNFEPEMIRVNGK